MKIEYPSNIGKHGPVYQIAKGIRVSLREYGTWEVVLKHRGERKRKAFGEGTEGLKAAVVFAENLAVSLNKVIAEAGSGESPVPELAEGEKRLNQVADEWLTLNRRRWTASTEERYFGIVRDHIGPRLGKLPINKIDRAEVRKVLTEIAGKMSDKSVELIHSVLSGIFSEAAEMGLIEINPAQGLLKKLLPPKRKRAVKKPDPFKKSDLDWFLEAAGEAAPSPYPLIFRTLAHTGLRLGECLAMRWDNLDTVNNTYKVEETVRRDVYGAPKTGDRIIDLPESLTEELSAHVIRLRKAALKSGKPVDYLFPGISQAHVRAVMDRVCKRAGLRVRTPHALRHTYATLLLMAHVSPAYVQKQLGHHSITMTVDVYGHWMPGEGKRDLEKVCGNQVASDCRKEERVLNRC